MYFLYDEDLIFRTTLWRAALGTILAFGSLWVDSRLPVIADVASALARIGILVPMVAGIAMLALAGFDRMAALPAGRFYALVGKCTGGFMMVAVVIAIVRLPFRAAGW